MAITIVSNFTSGKFYPSANPINTTVTSNNSGKCNFRYICDLYVNGTKVFTDKIFPDPNTGNGFFLLSRVLQDYITTLPLANTTTAFSLAASATAPTAALSVYCRFGEEYDSSVNCDGTVLQYTNLTTSATFYVYEGAFDYEDYPSYNFSNYMMGTASATASKLFLTNSPREIEVTYNDSYYLDFLSLQTMNSAYRMYIQWTYQDGTSLETWIPSGTLSSTKRYRLAVGPVNINKLYNATIIGQDITSYKIWLAYNGIRQSEVFTFKLRDPKTFTTRLGFVGLLGGIENFTFFHRNSKSFNIDRKSYEKTLGRNISNAWSYTVGDRGTTTYKISASEQHRVSTYCSRDMSEWLYEMWLSPDVWTYRRPEIQQIRIYDEAGTYTGVPDSRILFWVNDTTGLAAGDYIFVVPEYISGYAEFQGRFLILSIDGNIVDVGATYASYFPPHELCAYIYKDTTFDRLPVVVADNNIEVKQKTTKPIEYSLSYQMAYSKNTLRG
jgi:hypothetical protein